MLNKMKPNILIVEDEFIVANDLRIMLEKSGYEISGIAPSVEKAVELIALNKPSWVLLDIFLKGVKTGIDLAVQLTEMEIPFIYISGNTNQTVLAAAKATLPYGFLIKPFRERDLTVMLDIAEYRHQQSLKYKGHKTPSISKQIELITATNSTGFEKLEQISTILQPALPFDFLWITKSNSKTSTKDINIAQLSNGTFKVLSNDVLLKETNTSNRDFKAWTNKAFVFNGTSLYNEYDFRKLRMHFPWIKSLSDGYNLESVIITEVEKDGALFQFFFFHHLADIYNDFHTSIITQFKESLQLMLEKISCIKDREIEVSDKKLSGFNTSTVKPKIIENPKNFYGIVGSSPTLLNVFKKMDLVAQDDTSVLILGESGTGKERIAQTIHKLSPRKNKPLITVNCATLPLMLIESELFGHEKGSFTGANDRRIGKFEQADGGTIFLDEIGELPLEAQVKLLRVLQEKEIERLGGNFSRKINVRIITATNRNLENEVSAGRFRLDLYYRLNVFPIELPALRQRKEDIPLLVEHFIFKYQKQTSSSVNTITNEVISDLQQYHWPGNIRELEHLIERTMLLTEGNTITKINLRNQTKPTSLAKDEHFEVKTMEEMEREHILRILKMCNGKIFGLGGAAELLKIPSTTLNSKIKKLGIKFEFVN